MKFLSGIWETISKLWKTHSVKEAALSVSSSTAAIPLQQTQPPKPPGLDCPTCGFRIIISVPMLLSGQPIVCPSCRLKLSVEREQSKACLTELEKVYDAVQKVEKLRK
jgi:DNA-directed RNA polymerase subunit RPC12/RpoP